MKKKEYKKINKVEVFDYTNYEKTQTLKVHTFTVSKKNTNVRTIQINKDGILRVFITPKHLKNPICTQCVKPATKQTANGKYQEEIGALPQNFGWYCDKCMEEGIKMEQEAMYG